MVSLPLVVAPYDGGWCVALQHEDGTTQPMTFPWETKEEAERFLQITRPDLGFIPSKLV